MMKPKARPAPKRPRPPRTPKSSNLPTTRKPDAPDRTGRPRTREKIQAILGTMMDGFCLVDKDGRYLDANEVYCRMTGYRREELLKMRIKDVEALETEQDVHERIRRIMEQGATRFETKHKCKDGKVIDVEVSVNAPADETLLVFLRDITGRKRLAEERELTLRLLDRINSCADLRELMREMTRFASRRVRLRSRRHPAAGRGGFSLL